MKTILVTGGAGFIASNFVRMVLAEQPEYFVVNLDKLTYAGNLENLAEYLNHKNHKFIKGDICDGPLIEKIIDEHKIEAIINFAAESHVDRSITEPKNFIETNVTGTLTLLQPPATKSSSDSSRFPQTKFTAHSAHKENSPSRHSFTPTHHIQPAKPPPTTS